MKIKGAIFDMDGTLIDSLSFWDHLWGLIGARYMNDPAFRPCEEVDKAVRTMIYTDAMTYVKEYYGIGGSTEDFLQFTGNILPDFYKNVATVKEGAFALLDHLRGLWKGGGRIIQIDHGFTSPFRRYSDTAIPAARRARRTAVLWATEKERP